MRALPRGCQRDFRSPLQPANNRPCVSVDGAHAERLLQ
jgi:hypothetical protein